MFRPGPRLPVTETGGGDFDHDQKVMHALVTAAALVALADGRVEAVERDATADFIERQGFVPSIDRPEIVEAFDDCVRRLADRDSAHAIARAFQPLAGLSLASIVVRTAEQVAAADRHIHAGELRALNLIRLLMTTLPAQRPGLPIMF
jgi:tellurite resistance protein